MHSRFSYPLEINEYNRDLVDAAVTAANELYDQPIKALPYTTFRLFEQQGSREEYESEYMIHRKMLCAFTAAALTIRDSKWIDKLCDIVWAVCDEFTWALPAHVVKSKTAVDKVERIDLFAAETAIALCEIYHIFESVLPDGVKSRIQYEVRRRIIDSYKRRCNRFPVSNWSAVCACGVGAAFVYLGEDGEFEEVKENLVANMQDFLKSYTDDGCCLEGALYWSYGFSHFCYLAELLREHTNGDIDFFKNEKVRRMAFFYQNINLGDNYFVPFSDAPHTCNYDSSLLFLLSEKYDGIIIPPTCYENKFGDFGNDSRYRFAPFIRNLYWGRLPGENTLTDKNYTYYSDAEWYINKSPSFSFAAKAGHNDEPHNHNDVGSFILFDSGKFIIEDIGWAKYDKAYFDGEKRYENICASSFGHSVPIVSGCAQKSGKEHCAKVIKADEFHFEIDLAGAYGCSSLRSYIRRFTVVPTGIEISDHTDSDVKLVSRFITSEKPVIAENSVRIDGFELSCNQDISPIISCFEYTPRFEGFATLDESSVKAYSIDFDISGYKNVQYSILKITK